RPNQDGNRGFFLWRAKLKRGPFIPTYLWYNAFFGSLCINRRLKRRSAAGRTTGYPARIELRRAEQAQYGLIAR
ncbi:MAG: hypothetical protein IIY32_10130, partial [Thermoguttaceae bacterium]|nr:hypothetical protein [Thermoguttaceae bacterium]